MKDLSSAWRMADAPESHASDDTSWVHTMQFAFDEMERLGLSIAAPKPEPKRRGRPPKAKDPDAVKPKRPRGRPRKNP